MSSPSSESTRTNPLNWRPTSRQVTWPSMSFSLALHALVLLLIASQLRSCGNAGIVGDDLQYRDVGLVFEQNADVTEPSEQPSSNSPAETAPTLADPLDKSAPQAVTDSPPVDLELPETSEPILGVGSPTGSAAASNAPSSTATGNVVSGGTYSPPAAPGSVKFFDAVDTGTSFLFLLDSSGSMSNFDGAPIRRAKSEAMASLRSLTQNQRFQILFYNTKSRALARQGHRPELLYASTVNRTLAQQFVRSISPSGGTRHVPALHRALAFKPDVIFLLTDADEPRMRQKELDDVQKLNGGHTRIHCIEFGRGNQLAGDNFLKKLARANGGTYSYRNIERLAAETP